MDRTDQAQAVGEEYRIGLLEIGGRYLPLFAFGKSQQLLARNTGKNAGAHRRRCDPIAAKDKKIGNGRRGDIAASVEEKRIVTPFGRSFTRGQYVVDIGKCLETRGGRGLIAPDR